MLGGFALMALGFLAGFGPLLAYFLNTPGMYFGRGQGVLTWNRFPTSWDDLLAAWNTLWPIMSVNLLAFSTESGRDAFYFGSLLFPVEAALLVLGFGLLVWRWKHPAAFLMLLSGLAVLFVGGTLVPSAANLNHWTPAYPAFYTAIALPIAAWVASAGAFRFPRSIRPPVAVRRAAFVVVIVSIALLGAWNVDYYFNRYKASLPDAEVLTDEHRTQADLALKSYILRNIGRTYYGIDSLAVGYLSRAVEADAGQLFNPPAELPLAMAGPRGAAFFFRDSDQFLPIVKSLYPGGEVIPVTMENGRALYNTYVVPGDRINATYGVFVQLMDPTSGALMRSDHVNVVGTLPRGVSFPLRARWSGAFFLGNGGPYEIAVHGAPATLMVDGVGSDGADGSVVRTMQAGWHRFMVTVDLAVPTPITFTAGLPGSGAGGFVFPREQLWPEPPGMGLFGSVLGADLGSGQRPVPRVDPYIAFGSVAQPWGFGPVQGASFPVSARWVGEINAPVAGSYNLEVRTDGQAHLIVDGTQDVWACEGMDRGGVATVELSTGWHPIVLDYVGMPGTSDLHLWWSMPGGGRTLVPPSALRYFPADGSTLPDLPAPSTSIQCPAR
jgi:hypothetical protein